MRRPRFYVLALTLGLLFFAASLTPTLIPRCWVVQGTLGGLVMAMGYLIGRAALSIWRLLELPEATGGALTRLRIATVLPILIVLILCLLQARSWQNGVRERMEMAPLETTHTLQMLALAILIFVLLFVFGLAVQWLFDRVRGHLYRYMPRRAANVAGFVVTVLVLLIVTRDGMLDRFIGALDASYTTAQALFDAAPPIPDGIETGGAESLVDWSALGKPGGNYVTSGPSAADIAAFTGRPAI